MTVFGTDLVMVSAVFNISIFSVYFLYMRLHILYFIIVCHRARWSAGALGDGARYKARDAVTRSAM